MRFIANGPSIPDELLTARDDGRVIFFCGAGVSRARANLPDFFGLAEKVVGNLGVEPGSPARKLIAEVREMEARVGMGGLVSADRVFGLLERDFLVEDIAYAVAQALKPAADVDLSAHQIMLDLATGPDRRARLVTTNFDLLFEKCDRGVPIHQPPSIPNPRRHDHLVGIIHLHGRVDDGYTGAHGDGFILSSAEFGRAYLAEGWATEFIRAVLSNYSVVFVGYTADDPPIQYLLEALNRSENPDRQAFAFQAGSSSQANAKWAHKGVKAIAYEDADNHQALWGTLEAWAGRARNPDGWYEKTIALARLGPEALLPHERGQVAHLVSTLEGARKFAEAKPLAPAEWLCVFDPHIRYLKPGRRYSYPEKGPLLNPFAAYGLDSDPVPPDLAPDNGNGKREVPNGVWSCLVATRVDRQNLREENFAALIGHWSNRVSRLPNRLYQVGVWIAQVAHEPAAVWWAAQQHAVHPDIQWMITHQLNRSPGDRGTSEVRRAWHYLFDAWDVQGSEARRDLYELLGSIKIDGWTTAFVRRLALLCRPYIEAKRNWWIGPKPPERDAPVSDMIRLDIEYPNIDSRFEIPDHFLPEAIQEFRKSLEHAIALEEELGGHGLHNLSPINPDQLSNGEAFGRTLGLSRLLLLFVSQFSRLLATNASAAREEFGTWRPSDKHVFGRLRIWAASLPTLLPGTEAGRVISETKDDVFWEARHQRDLLLTLATRWAKFPKTCRTSIERRLLRGPPRWQNEKKAHYIERRAWQSLSRIHWLAGQGCAFHFDLVGETAKLRRQAPEWRMEYAVTSASSLESRSGWVETITDHSPLLAVPLNQVLDRATELNNRNQVERTLNDPFAGLVSNRSVRAFSALTDASRRGHYPEWAWRSFLNSEKRKSDKPKFAALIAERLCALPMHAFAALAYPTSEWLLAAGKTLRTHPRQFGNVWDKLITTLALETDAGRSALVANGSPRDWVTEALNAPVGKLAQVLLDDPETEGLGPREGFPQTFVHRIEQLLTLNGDLRQHALVMLSFNLRWYFSVDPIWTEKNILPVLQADNRDSHATWAGFLWNAHVPNADLFVRLKPQLLERAREKHSSERANVETLAGILLAGWGSHNPDTGERWITSLCCKRSVSRTLGYNN